MKKLIALYKRLIKTENVDEIELIVNEISVLLNKIHFGMDKESESVTKKDIVKELEEYILNPNNKSNILIRTTILNQQYNDE